MFDKSYVTLPWMAVVIEITKTFLLQTLQAGKGRCNRFGMLKIYLKLLTSYSL